MKALQSTPSRTQCCRVQSHYLALHTLGTLGTLSTLYHNKSSGDIPAEVSIMPLYYIDIYIYMCIHTIFVKCLVAGTLISLLCRLCFPLRTSQLPIKPPPPSLLCLPPALEYILISANFYFRPILWVYFLAFPFLLRVVHLSLVSFHLRPTLNILNCFYGITQKYF